MLEPLDVLLVEDEATVAEMYRLKLELEGYRVRICGDAPTALRAALDTLPDLLLLDIRLPRSDGLELLVRLRADERTRAVPTVVFSNYHSDELVQRGRDLGGVDHLVKSETTPARLCQWIDRWRSGGHAERRPSTTSR